MPDRDDCPNQPNQPQMLEEIELVHPPEGTQSTTWHHVREIAKSLATQSAENSVGLKSGLYWLAIACLVFGFVFLMR
jgi:hypothetical protein